MKRFGIQSMTFPFSGACITVLRHPSLPNYTSPTAAAAFASACVSGTQQRFRSSSSSYRGGMLYGKTLCFTGTLSMPRRQAILMAERSGAEVVTKFSSRVTHVVTGSGAGSKLSKAQATGTTVWTEGDFRNKMTVEDHEVRLNENQGRLIRNVNKTGYQFSLAWDALVDLDLKLETPSGLVYFDDRKISGAHLDVDRIPDLGREWNIRPVENIVCDRAAPGFYKAVVVYYSNFNDVRGPIPYTLHCRVGKDHGCVLHNTISKVGNGVGGDKEGETVCTFEVKNNGEVTNVHYGASGRHLGAWSPSSSHNYTTRRADPVIPEPRSRRVSTSSSSSSRGSSRRGGSSLFGKKVCFTGVLSMKRTVASAKAVNAGASVVSDVGRNTDVLVIGARPGSKLEYARHMGKEVLTEAEFLRRV